jgi:ABC-type bacteriocin/lantibiotic exporter with double-glycine peptidase domain
MAAAYKIIPGIVKIMNSLSQVKTYAYSSEGLANKITVAENSSSNETISSVAFENIFFNYPDKEILNAFSFKITRGDMIGISGLSGKGKTTIANLLLGFLEADAGAVYINEKITGLESRQAFWNKIAYVKQQPFFIHASIIKNITLRENGYDEEKIKRIIHVTGLDRLISELPMGLETIITENGKNFSGGQRQRIIFARALYKDSDLFILDEPFNELDEASETAMLKQLQIMSNEGKMIFLITHNKTALSFCNKKIEMDEQQL